MKISKDAKKIIQEAIKQNGIEQKILLTNKNIYELSKKNILKIDFFLEQDELINKIIETTTQYKKTNIVTPIILSSKNYIDIPEQNEFNKNSENYHKLNSAKSITSIIKKYFSKTKNQTILNYYKNPTTSPTINLMQAMQIKPEDTIKYIGKIINSNSPKIGYAFKTFQKSIIAVTWKNIAEGYLSLKQKKYEIKFQDKKPYAGIVTATIINNENKSEYKATIKAAFINPNKQKDAYRYYWTPEIYTTSEDYDYKTGTKKQKSIFQYATKDIVALLYKSHEHFFDINNIIKNTTNFEQKDIINYLPNKFIPTPNQSFLNLAEVINNVLVIKINEKKETVLLKANETIQNMLMDKIIQKYGAEKFFT